MIKNTDLATHQKPIHGDLYIAPFPSASFITQRIKDVAWCKREEDTLRKTDLSLKLYVSCKLMEILMKKLTLARCVVSFMLHGSKT